MNTQLINAVLRTDAGLGATVLRSVTGLVLAAHGAQKLFGWFGGYGLSATGEWMASIGLAPGLLMAVLAGSAEFFGGLALMLGVLTRPAAALAAVTMLVAMLAVHWEHGFFLANNGVEYALVLFAASLSLLAMGGGRWSVDAAISRG